MLAKLCLTLSVVGLVGMLAACGAEATVDLTTPAPSEEATISSTPARTPEAQAGPSLARFDCENVQEIPVAECQALVALYQNTDGQNWLDHSGWLLDQTPCSWYGIRCEQGHVVELQLFYNGLSGSLPPEIGNLTQLKSLYLDDNQLGGPLPPEIGKLANLELARLGGNHLNSLPPEIANLDRLIYLELWDNQLSGKIPSELGDLSNLQELKLGFNQFTGSIPPALGNLAYLHRLDLSHNELSGSIPAIVGDLINLNELDLSFNQLSGPIPIELQNLHNLYWLNLSYNQLTGVIPADMAQAPISERRLWGNLFDGTILASAKPTTTADYQGIHTEFDSSLITSIWPETVPAQAPNVDGSNWQAGPEHVRLIFVYPSKGNELPIGRSAAFGPAQLLIYPTQTYGAMNDFARQEIDELQAMLEARPPSPAHELPVLPPINAAQVFHAQLKYLDFQNGRGVRFITQYNQDVSPITNQMLFYTFQGLTEDGAYYVAAHFPLAAEGLDNEPAVENWDAFSAGFKDYLADTVVQLNDLSSQEFQPNLDLLDHLVQSIVVDTP